MLSERSVSSSLLTAGQPTEAQLRAIAEAGFEAVVNLAPEEDPRSLPGEADLVRSLGLQYINIPVIFRMPKIGEVEQFFALMDHLKGRRVFVHCLANKRVTAFLGLYWLRQGMPFEEAFTLMRDVWREDNTWDDFIAEGVRKWKFPESRCSSGG